MGAGGLCRDAAAFCFLAWKTSLLFPLALTPSSQGTLQPGEEPVRGRALPGPNPRQASEAIQPARGEAAWDGSSCPSCPSCGALEDSCCACFSPPQLTDYINASFMDGYKQRNAYIGTQGMA